MHLQEIEGNPLDAEQIAMFEMFERERWSHEKRLALYPPEGRQGALRFSRRMSDQVYCYPPDHLVLRNKLDLRDAGQLDFFERELVAQRAAQGIPSGKFDLAHLRAIHRHLFQDVHDWAGELRTVEIAKGGNQFQFRQYITTGMADVHISKVWRDRRVMRSI